MAKTVLETILCYKEMETMNASSSMLSEVKWQYANMANGGDGGDLGFERNGETTCRGINYEGYPNSFFQEVCTLMGWRW